MGYFAKKTTEELTAAREIPIGGWLVAASKAFPSISSTSLLHAAVMRIDFTSMLKNVVTYVGTSSETNAISEALSSGPSSLSISSRGRALVVGLGTLGFPKSGGFHHPFDWQFRLIPNETRSSALFEVVSARTKDDALINAAPYKALLAALHDVLIDGVHLDEVVIDGWDGMMSNLQTAPDLAPERAELRIGGDLPLPENAAAILPMRIWESTVPPRVRARLEGSGFWPLVAHGHPSIPLSQFDLEEQRLVAEFLDAAAVSASEGSTERSFADDLRRSLAGIARAPVTTTIAGRDGLANGAKRLPFAVRGVIPDCPAFIVGRMAASSCKTSTYSVKVSRKSELTLYDRPGRDSTAIEYGTSGAPYAPPTNTTLTKGMVPHWAVDYTSISVPEREVERTARIQRSSHSASEMTRASVPLLELFGATAEILAMHGPVQFWTIDRTRGWSGAQGQARTVVAPVAAANPTSFAATTLAQPTEASETSAHQTFEPPTADAATQSVHDTAASAVQSATSEMSESGNPARWIADPTGRHDLRYWDGDAWTNHVSDAGVTSVDRL